MLKRFGHFLFYGYFGLFFLITLGLSSYFQAYKSTPPQPVKYPHDRHLNAGLKCENCHRFAGTGQRATLPALEYCMSCHTSVLKDSPEIQKLAKAWEEKKPIQWNRLHRLQDFVYFSHKRHIKANIPCQSCHGEVEGMSYPMKKNRSLTMGFCVGCHREKGASLDCYTCHK